MRLMKSESANNAFLEPSNCTKYSRAWSRAALRINEGQRGSSFFFSTALISMESKEARASGATVPTPKEQAELECVCASHLNAEALQRRVRNASLHPSKYLL